MLELSFPGLNFLEAHACSWDSLASPQFDSGTGELPGNSNNIMANTHLTQPATSTTASIQEIGDYPKSDQIKSTTPQGSDSRQEWQVGNLESPNDSW